MTRSAWRRWSRAPLRISLTVFAILALVIAASLLRRPVPEKNQTAPTGFNFHPDAVKKIDWIVAARGTLRHEHKVELTRASRREPWSSEVPTEQVQAKINLLSELAYRPMRLAHPSITSVTLGFGPGNEWRADYDGERLVWNAGTLKGQGAELAAPGRQIFEQGRYAFDPLKFEWCSARPVRMEVAYKSKKFDLQNIDHRWVGQGGRGSHPLDASAIEQWLGRHCSVAVTSFRDLAVFPFDSKLLSGLRASLRSGPPDPASGVFNVWFADQKRIRLEIRDGTFVISPDQALRSPVLDQGLAELAALAAK